MDLMHRRVVSYLEVVVALIFSGVALTTLWDLMHKGIGFADETLYLIMADSSDTSFSYGGLWSFYTHYVSSIIDGDIFKFRIIGASLLIVLATLLGVVTCAVIGRSKLNRWNIAGCASIVGLASLFFYQKFLLVPGYDWLTLIGLVTGLIGCVLSHSTQIRSIIIGSILIGVGSFIASAGRPLAGIIFLISVLIASRLQALGGLVIRVRYILGAIASMALFHLFFVANVTDTIDSFSITQRLSNADPSHSIAYLIKATVVEVLLLPYRSIVATYGMTLILLTLLIAMRLKPRLLNYMQVRNLVIIIALLEICLIFFTGRFGGGVSGEKNGIAWFSLAVTFAMSMSIMNRLENSPLNTTATKSTLILVVPIVGAIVGATFTTNIGVIALSAQSAVFYVVMMLICVVNVQDSVVQKFMYASLSIVVMVGLVVALHSGQKAPYDGAPTSLQTNAVQLGPHNSTLLVDQERKNEIDQVRAFRGIGLNQTVVNLTPVATYIPFELGFKNIQTLLLPNQKFTEQYVADNAKQLKDAWFVTTNDDFRATPSNPVPVAKILNRNFPADYQLMATFKGKYCLFTDCSVDLWKPIR